MKYTKESMQEKILARLDDGRGQAELPKHDGCAYRSPTGVPCAVGCLIDDEHYNPAMETASMNQVCVATELKVGQVWETPDDGGQRQILSIADDFVSYMWKVGESAEQHKTDVDTFIDSIFKYSWWDASGASWRGYEESAALAQVLNNQGIPATEEIHNFLNVWQKRHDLETNWDGNEYVGPRWVP